MADNKERRGKPRFHAEHVVLSVIEERKVPELGKMLRHQADDGLIGIEVEAFVPDRNDRAEEDEENGQCREEPQRRVFA